MKTAIRHGLPALKIPLIPYRASMYAKIAEDIALTPEKRMAPTEPA